MPTYEYECLKCGRVFDVVHGMSESGPKRCVSPRCKGKVKRLISAGSGLIFKGSGFYITDYKRKPAETAARSESGASEAGTSDAGASTAKAPAKTEKAEKKTGATEKSD